MRRHVQRRARPRVRRTVRTGATFGLTLACVAGLAAGVPAGASAYAADEPVREISWAPCEEAPNFDCGTLELPVDWSDPEGETFQLALARRPANDPDARIGSLFVNPGGPGGSGVDMALGSGGYFSSEVLDRFDIIGFDPRGIARSNPVVCSVEAAEAPGYTVLPTNQAEFDALVAYNKQLAEDCREHTGPLIDHVDSVSVAHDIDAIRAALGEERINWFGLSYGTLMGQMYAEQYPDRIRSMVLDSVMDHSLDTRGFLLTEAWTVEDSFEEFVAWCDRDADCALHGQDVGAVWDELVAKAEAGELTDPGGNPISWIELIDSARSSSYGPNWANLAEGLAALQAGPEAASDQAGSEAGLSAIDETTNRWGADVLQDQELVQYPFAVFCEDWKFPISNQAELDRLWKQSRRVAPHTMGSMLAVSATTGCLGWPGETNNPQHRLDVEDSPTLLMLNSLHDPATGYVWAANAARQLGKSASLVTYEGWGHGVYPRSACTREVVDAYLLDRVAPEPGSRCPAVEPESVTVRAGGDSRPPGAVRDRPAW